MANKRSSIATVAAVLLSAVAPPSTGAGSGLLEQTYSQAWARPKSRQYIAPQPDELAAAHNLFVRILRGEPVPALTGTARTQGWSLQSETRAGITLLVLAEPRGQAGGRGIYAFSSAGRHALQAPHVPTDGLTGEILLRFAQDGLPRAMAWNTVTRKAADLAHLDGSYLIAFSRAFAEVHPNEKILQLHGFDADRRRTSAGGDSGAIVSATHSNPPADLKAAVRCMQQQVEPRTRLFGVDVRELGGTTNSIGRALRAGGYDNFVHVEMALPLRERLLDDAAQRRALFTCLGGQR